MRSCRFHFSLTFHYSKNVLLTNSVPIHIKLLTWIVFYKKMNFKSFKIILSLCPIKGSRVRKSTFSTELSTGSPKTYPQFDVIVIKMHVISCQKSGKQVLRSHLHNTKYLQLYVIHFSALLGHKNVLIMITINRKIPIIFG